MFFFLHHFDRNQVLVRLQHDAVSEGLRQIDPNLIGDSLASGGEPGPGDTIVIQYIDVKAIKQAAGIKQRTGCKIVCFGSDVIDDRMYVALDPLVDHFLMPTPLHRDIAAASVWSPCHVLPEGIDPIALPGNASPVPITDDISLGWFGHARNFGATFGRIFERATKLAGVPAEEITFISSPGQELLSGAIHIPFSNETFYADSARFSYAMLSHFPYDSLINTYIKSPNKLITSLVRGLTPLISATPSYQVLARQYELQHLTFRNGPELTMVLRRLSELRLDSGKLAAIRADLHDRLAPKRIAQRFLELVG